MGVTGCRRYSQQIVKHCPYKGKMMKGLTVLLGLLLFSLVMVDVTTKAEDIDLEDSDGDGINDDEDDDDDNDGIPDDEDDDDDGDGVLDVNENDEIIQNDEL